MKHGKIVYNYETGKAIIYTLLILNILSFASFPKSHAKYFTDKPNALAYDADVYKLYKKNVIQSIDLMLSTSTIDLADFTFSFPRNEIGTFKEKDEYEIVVPNGCTIQKINAKATNSNKVSYAPDNTRKTTTVSMKCEVDKVVQDNLENGRKEIYFNVKVKETVDQERQFDYTDKKYQYPYDLYASKFDKPPVGEVTNVISIKKDDPNMYNTFIEWIKKYAATTDFETSIIQYVERHCENGSLDFILANSLPGIYVSEDKETNSYVFSLSDNFIGYAQQYVQNVDSFMYFTTTDVVELQAAFELYLRESFLKKYNEPEKTELFNLITAYVKSFDGNGISYMILGGNVIPGLVPNSSSGDDGVQRIMVIDTIIDYAYNKMNKQIRIGFNTSALMMSAFKESVPIVYDESTVSKETIDTLQTTYPSVLMSVIQNNITITEKTSFNDYFIVYDDKLKRNVLINVYSNAGLTPNDKYNYAKVLHLDYDNFNFSESSSKFRVHAKDEATIREFVAALDTVYGKTTTLVDGDFARDRFGVLSVEYSTVKPEQSTPVENEGSGSEGDSPEVEGKPEDSSTEENNVDNSDKPEIDAEGNDTQKVEEETVKTEDSEPSTAKKQESNTSNPTANETNIKTDEDELALQES